MASTYVVERSTVVPAAPARVQDLIEDFHRWTEWSPWEGLDPDLQRNYTGSERGVGAAYSWSGNRKAGKGRMEITDVVPGEKVVISLVFEKPFPSSNVATFVLRPVEGGTEVRWLMEGPRPLLMRVLGPVMSMDKIVGKDFEQGLAALSAAAAR